MKQFCAITNSHSSYRLMIKTITSSLTAPRFAFALLPAPWRGHVLLKSWQAERVKPTAEKFALNSKYQSLKEEIRDMETIRRYVEGLERTVAPPRIAAALPHMDREMRDIAARSAAKLATMTEGDFAALSFEPDTDDEGE